MDNRIGQTKRRYYLKNREKILAYRKGYQKKYKERILIWRRKNYRENRGILLQNLGGKCVECGYSDLRALQFDHIKDDGNIDKKRFNNDQLTMVRYYRKHLEEARIKLQILCANCNFIKQFR